MTATCYDRQGLLRYFETHIIGNASQITLGDLEQKALPDTIKQRLAQLIEARFDRERPLRLIFPERFDLSDPLLRKELQAIKQVFIERYRLQRGEILQLFQAVLNELFLLFVNPFFYLTQRLFGNKQEIDRGRALETLAALPIDHPLVLSVSEFLQASKEKQLTRSYFEQILGESRKQLYEESPVSAVMAEVDLFRRLMSELRQEPCEAFPVPLLQKYFENRNMRELATSLPAEAGTKWTMTVEQIQNYMERYLLVGTLETEGDSGTRNQDEAQLHQTTQRTATESAFTTLQLDFVDEDTTNRTTATETLHKEHFPAAGREHPANGRSSTTPGADENEQATGSDPQNDSMTDTGTAFELKVIRGKMRIQAVDSESGQIPREKIEEQPPGPYPSLYTFMDQKTRKVFIKKLFGNDEEAFARFVEKIDRAESWKEARALLEQELRARNIHIYDRNAIKLSDFLFSRYFSHRRY